MAMSLTISGLALTGHGVSRSVLANVRRGGFEQQTCHTLFSREPIEGPCEAWIDLLRT